MTQPTESGRPPGEHTDHPPAARIAALLRLLLVVIADNRRLRAALADRDGN